MLLAFQILGGIIVFSLLVVIHELGHFWAAKSFNIRVHEFAVGMGPAIWKKQKGETLYSLRCIPLGGFCSMGEDESSDSERAFVNASGWKKITVLAAGGIFNLIAGLLLCFVFVSSQPTIDIPTVTNFAPESTLQQAGVQIGDEVISIDGKRVHITQAVNFRMQIEQNEKTIVLSRNGERYTVKATPYLNDDGMYILGFVTGKLENTAWNTIKYGWHQFTFFIDQIAETLTRLLTGRLSLRQLSGPVGIASVIGEAVGDVVVKANWWFLGYIFILITINLGIFNLIPFPALDGGRIFFVLVNMLLPKGKKLKTEHEGYVHAIGFALLIGLIIVVTGFDINNLMNK